MTASPCKQEKDIFYLPQAEAEADAYQREKCRLDLYYPADKKPRAILVWFHGGALKADDKQDIPALLTEQGYLVVSANYRLSPRVKCPAYIEDAAAAVAWTGKNAARYGADPARMYVSGSSAGAYLALMLGLDKRWLAVHGVDADTLAGLIPLTGQAITHLTVREERGISDKQPIIDEFAPLYHVRPGVAPILLVTGDRELELLGRCEENAYFLRMLKLNGNQDVIHYELQGYGHNASVPGTPLAVDWLNERLARIQPPAAAQPEPKP